MNEKITIVGLNRGATPVLNELQSASLLSKFSNVTLIDAKPERVQTLSTRLKTNHNNLNPVPSKFKPSDTDPYLLVLTVDDLRVVSESLNTHSGPIIFGGILATPRENYYPVLGIYGQFSRTSPLKSDAQTLVQTLLNIVQPNTHSRDLSRTTFHPVRLALPVLSEQIRNTHAKLIRDAVSDYLASKELSKSMLAFTLPDGNVFPLYANTPPKAEVSIQDRNTVHIKLYLSALTNPIEFQYQVHKEQAVFTD